MLEEREVGVQIREFALRYGRLRLKRQLFLCEQGYQYVIRHGIEAAT
ncbi:MAG: hypothetical protein HY922_12145 [Elusimicrobia bacterium]|nr:hypothetical protein [Elusimicrobiota bacterium]